MSASRYDAGLQRDEADMSAGGASNPLYTPWQALSALANETGQAVKHTFTDSSVGKSGHVQQSAVHHAALNAQAASPAAFDRNLNAQPVDAAETDVKTPSSSGRIDHASVQADIRRVERKMISTDAAKEVILRFNFLSGRESRVRHFSHAMPWHL